MTETPSTGIIAICVPGSGLPGWLPAGRLSREETTMPTWDDILTDRDKEVFALSGYGAKAGFGQRPAVLVIDVNYNFVGDRREPILESVKRFRNSCGEEGWVGVDHIVTLLEEARKKHLPIFYTTGHGEEQSVAFGRARTARQLSVR